MPSAFLCRINFYLLGFFYASIAIFPFCEYLLKNDGEDLCVRRVRSADAIRSYLARRKKVGGLKKQTAEHKERRQVNFSENRSIGVLIRFERFNGSSAVSA